ncbi:MAG: YegS/Rv2252/BmrU family lipid kinase [bacterium]|nr:YegS/Rv2252/BmrU family lipid kinase [bacterium]
MKTLMLVNPRAGGRGNVEVVESARSRFAREGWDISVVRSQDINEGIAAINKAVDNGLELLVLCGGDGTIHSSIQHLPSGTEESLSPLPFGIIPLGSGNDVYRGLGAPRDPIGAAENIIFGKPVPIDAGTVFPVNIDGSPRNEKPIRFINTAGVGIDSQTLVTRAKSPRWLSARYEIIFLLTLASLKPISASLEADDWNLDIEAYWILACNNAYIGTGMHVAPDAKIDDGLMDVLLVPKKPKLEFMMHFNKVFTGRHFEIEGVHIRKAKNLLLKCDPIQRLACDGDLAFLSPARISIEKGVFSLRTSWLNGKKL